MNTNYHPTTSRGFTLLEVMVALAILATLLTVIIQSQSETIFFLEKTSKLENAHREVTKALLAIERGDIPKKEKGIFPEDHPLASERWKFTRKPVKMPKGIPNKLLPLLEKLLASLEEIKYEIIWGPKKQEQSFSDVLLRQSAANIL